MPGKTRQTQPKATPAVEPAVEPKQAPAKQKTVAGRPACYLVDECGLPEYQDNVGLCGRHWVHRPDLRKVARRG